MVKTVIEEWNYHPGFCEDTRIISDIRYNAKGEPMECIACCREYRPHTIACQSEVG